MCERTAIEVLVEIQAVNLRSFIQFALDEMDSGVAAGVSQSIYTLLLLAATSSNPLNDSGVAEAARLYRCELSNISDFDGSRTTLNERVVHSLARLLKDGPLISTPITTDEVSKAASLIRAGQDSE